MPRLVKKISTIRMALESGAFWPVKVAAIRTEADDVKTIVLDTEVPYKAGQFISILSPDGQHRRSYSFSTSPDTDAQRAITVKRIANGILSRYLIDSIKPGEELMISGPYGFFTLPGNIDSFRQVVLIAAGIGITPVVSLIKSLLATKPSIYVTLIYSNTSTGTTLFYDELQKLQFKYPARFAIEFLFSSAADLSRARLSKTLLPQLLNEHLQHSKQETLFYTCGPFAYMRMVLLALGEERIPAAHIRKENFSTDAIVRKTDPPDISPHMVTIKHQGDTFSFQSAYPDTILQAARKNGINLPFSCENGICGSCVARCTKGSVWHRNNEVLTDAELESGLVLTCTGYPVNAGIELEIK